MMEDNFTFTPRERLQAQNMSLGIRLIELTEPFDTLKYKPFLKHYILQTVLKTELYFTFFRLGFVWHLLLQY